MTFSACGKGSKKFEVEDDVYLITPSSLDAEVEDFIVVDFSYDYSNANIALDSGSDILLQDQSLNFEVKDAAVDALLDRDISPAWIPPVASSCPSSPGMAGVHMPDGRCYLIDSWFVTQREYYLATKDHIPISNHPHCINHDGVGPRVWLGERYSDLCVIDQEYQEESMEYLLPWPPSDENLDRQMHCLTWCDASAYCESLGKRLCNNSSLDISGDISYKDDEWLNACTGGGTRMIPYHDQSSAPGCLSEPLDRTSRCEGGFEGVWFYSRDISNTPMWKREVNWMNLYCEESGPAFSRTPEPNPPADYVGSREYAGIRCCADEPVE